MTEKPLCGFLLVAASLILHGVHLCYARLSLLYASGRSPYSPKLHHYFDPVLLAGSILILLIGIILLLPIKKKKA